MEMTQHLCSDYLAAIRNVAGVSSHGDRAIHRRILQIADLWLEGMKETRGHLLTCARWRDQ